MSSSPGLRRSTKPLKVYKVSIARRRSARLSSRGASAVSTKPPSGNSTPRIKPQWHDQSYKLFITTPTKIAVWHGPLLSTIFTSSSEGIIAAKRAKDGALLAVADSQTIVLHKIDANGPNNQSYRLKGISEHKGPIPRLLQYAHDSRCLFLTDSIHYGVQTYNLREDRVCEAAKVHQSPITNFAISCDSNLILSCSSNPPVIYLHNRTLNTTTDIKPKASSKPVISCGFHPTRKAVFVLSYADGVIAAYDSTRLVRNDKNRAAVRVGDAGTGGGEHIHSFSHLHDPNIAGGSCATAVQFIPGTRSRAISVGEDGRLFILDFEKKDVLGSWHVGAPATTLSIRPAVGKDAGISNETGWMVAIGTVHGKTYVFSGDGTRVCEQNVDASGGRILDVEWVSGDIDLPPDSPSSGAFSPSKAQTNDSLSSTNRYPRSPSSITKTTLSSHPEGYNQDSISQSTVSLHKTLTNPPTLPAIQQESLTAADWPEQIETFSAGYMQLFSPLRKKKSSKAVSVQGRSTSKFGNMLSDHRSAISAPQLWDGKSAERAKRAGPTPNASGTVSAVENEMGNLDLLGKDGIESTKVQPMSQLQQMPDDGNGIKGTNVFADGTINTMSMPLLNVKSDQPDSKSTANDSTLSLLSEIMSIRSKSAGQGSIGKGGGLALFAPYMSSRAGRGPKLQKAKQDSPGKDVGNGKACNGKLAEEDDNKVSNNDTHGGKAEDSTVAEEENNDKHKGEERGMSAVRGQREQTLPLHNSDLGLPDPGPGLEEESEASSDNIWLAEAKPRKPLRTKPPAAPATALEDKSGTINIDVASQSKKRKRNFHHETYSHERHEDTANVSPITVQSSSLENPISPVRPSSLYGSALGSGKSRRVGYQSSPHGEGSNNQDPDNDITRKPSNQLIAPINMSRSIGLESPPWKEAIIEINKGISKELRLMHDDILKMFERQERILEKLIGEMVEVKKENDKLRGELRKKG